MKVFINQYEFKEIENIVVDMMFDSIVSKFNMVCRFDPTNPIHLEIFKPFSFPNVKIFDSRDKLIFTGFIVQIQFVDTSAVSTISVNGVSKTGDLIDCSIPFEYYPISTIGQSISQIFNKILKPYNIDFKYPASQSKLMNTTIDAFEINVGDTVADLLLEVSRHYNIRIGVDEFGNIVSLNNQFNKGEGVVLDSSNTTEIRFYSNGNSYFNKIQVIKNVNASDDSIDTENIIETVQNELLDIRDLVISFFDESYNNDNNDSPNVNTPSFVPRLVYEESRGVASDSIERVKVYRTIHNDNRSVSSLAKTFRMQQYEAINIEVSSVINHNISIGDSVMLKSKYCYIPDYTQFVVKSKSIIKNARQGDKYKYNLVIPESITGNKVKKLWYQ